MSLAQIVSVDEGDVGRRALAILSDPGFVVSNMPFVVAVRGEEVTLQFSRLFFGFRDTYRLAVESAAAGSVRLVLSGRRSMIVVEYSLRDGGVEVRASYRGPRGWVVGKRLGELANSLLMAAIREAREKRGALAVGDLSSKLSSISWTSKLLMKSMLLKNELVMIPKGGLMSYIENLISGRVLQQYPVVYVSGNAENGSFRLIFVNGELKGVYAVIDGREHVGDEKALNMVEGITRIKVYASLGKPEEVLA